MIVTALGASAIARPPMFELPAPCQHVLTHGRPLSTSGCSRQKNLNDMGTAVLAPADIHKSIDTNSESAITCCAEGVGEHVDSATSARTRSIQIVVGALAASAPPREPFCYDHELQKLRAMHVIARAVDVVLRILSATPCFAAQGSKRVCAPFQSVPPLLLLRTQTHSNPNIGYAV